MQLINDCIWEAVANPSRIMGRRGLGLLASSGNSPLEITEQIRYVIYELG